MKIIQLALPLFVLGLALQRGRIFDLGPSAYHVTSTIKVATGDQETLLVLDSYVQVFNILEEPNVECINYELEIDRKDNNQLYQES